VATQGIRGGANREVLKRIADSGSIFMAWSDRDWVNEGAAVHISIVGFDGGEEAERTLNGAAVDAINPDLTSGADATRARLLKENAGLCFMGTTKVGDFDLDPETARKMLAAPLNPNGRPNSDVVRPWVNALDITRRPRGMYIIDFGVDMPEEEAALYEMPFEYLREHVYAERKSDNRDLGDKPRWLHGRPRPELSRACKAQPVHHHPSRFEASSFCVAGNRNGSRLSNLRHRPRRRLLLRRAALPSARGLGARAGHATARSGKRFPLHAHFDLRDLSFPLAAGK
jgi:hypothetical protein